MPSSIMEDATTMTDTDTPRRAMPLAIKVTAALAVVLIAQTVFHQDSEIGGVLGLLALAAVVALVLARPIVLRDKGARIGTVAAAGYALVLVDDPNPLALLLFAIALSLATLLPQRRFDHALLWVPRLVWHGLTALVRPWRDIAWAKAAQRRHGGSGGIGGLAAILALPIVGGALFLTLFANANPLIGKVFADIALPDLGTVIWRVLLGGIVFTAIWGTLRPRLPDSSATTVGTSPLGRYDLGVATLIVSLATFNAIFAVQNALDIAFLWSDAPLPAGITMADYAHQGAYALILTALLAAAIVLVTLRPGSAGAASRPVRWLVTLWIAQNLMLVASSALRLFDYIHAYGMTTLRLSALLWMTLVASGLTLILWRLLRGRSAAWLINANALGLALVLSMAGVVDLRATAATWNARVALRDGRAGAPLDLCYLAGLGSSGLLSLVRLERHAPAGALRDRLAYLRWQAQHGAAMMQSDWRSWSARGARRMGSVEAMVGTRRPPLRTAPDGRDCGGRIIHIGPQLTNGAQR
jgi:hypothetical protein